MGGRAKTVEQYARLVDQVIGELEDMLEASDYDFDAVENNTGFIEALLREVRDIRSSMADGSYQFGRSDLHFMRVVKQHSDRDLPCIRLFYDINQTHREGLEIQQ